MYMKYSNKFGGASMIYTVTFNPSIDYIVTVEDFKEGFVNRTSEELMFPGGKELMFQWYLVILDLKIQL